MRVHNGFTLIEFVIDSTIIGILVILLVLLINPFKQLAIIKNAERLHDLSSIKQALSLYYYDHSCYPQTLPFGKKWSDGSTIYMDKVPQDSACEQNKSSCYVYTPDTTSTCAQWNVVFAKQDSRGGMSSCILPCAGQFGSGVACSSLGSVDCLEVRNPYVSSEETPIVPDYFPSPTPKTVVIPTSIPLPTHALPTALPCSQADTVYSCEGGVGQKTCRRVSKGSGSFCRPEDCLTTCN